MARTAAEYRDTLMSLFQYKVSMANSDNLNYHYIAGLEEGLRVLEKSKFLVEDEGDK